MATTTDKQSITIEPVTLSGRWVRLEPVGEEHREELRAAAEDDRIWKHTTTVARGDGFDKWFTGALRWRETDTTVAFVVRRLADGKLIGSTRFLDFAPQNHSLEIGATWYHPEVWGTQVNPECKYLLLSHAFEKLGANRVQLCTDLRNTRSQAAIAKLGAVREGVLRSHKVVQEGRVRDSVLFSIVHSDWPQVKVGLEARLVDQPLQDRHHSFRWSGGDETFLDAPHVAQCGHVAIGRYGGTSPVGAHKNEDAALVWVAPDASWTFAALLDAHGSSESADLVLGRVTEMESEVAQLLGNSSGGRPVSPLWELSALVTRHLSDESFRRACAAVRGETALLLCAQKGAYLWWLSVGDIPLYVFHPEFARLGQFALNQRMFFEWVGQVNTFALPVPCYTTGVRQLRPGMNRFLLTTDGLLECGTHPFENPATLYELFASPSINGRTTTDAVQDALDRVCVERGGDSASLIAWEVNLPDAGEAMQSSA